jgi:hypothetical protein
LRSSTPGNVPAVSTRSPGELWTNFPDKQLGHIDTSQTAQKLLAVRFFSTLASYVAGDLVVQAGAIYAANTSVPASAFNPAQWDKIVTVSALPAPYVLPIASTTVLGGVKVDGVTVIIDGTGKISAEGAVTVAVAPPSAPYVGALWYDTVGGQLYVYYFDGNSSQWVAASNQNIAGLYLPLTGGTVSGGLTVTGGINATSIGATTPAAGTFSTLASPNVNLTGGTISSAVAITGLMRGHIGGLGTTWVSNTQISIAPGEATSDDNTTLMSLGATLTKTLGSAWAPGNAGMLDSGALAQAWYCIYLIYNPTTQVVDVLASQSATAPTLPSGYTKKRRIWAIVTGASPFNISSYTQVGEDCIWYNPFQVINGQMVTTGPTLLQTISPPGFNCEAELSVQFQPSGVVGTLYLWPTYANTASPILVGNVVGTYVAGYARVMSNTAAQFNGQVTGSTTNNVVIAARGYRDSRGRFA